MALRDLMAADLAGVILSPGDFGEVISYQPSGALPKSITALVSRRPSRVGQNGEQVFPEHLVEVLISDDATAGIATVTVGADLMSVKLNRSDEAVTEFSVTKILEQVPGRWKLEGER